LALTRSNSHEIAEQAFKAGAQAFLTKNTTEDELRKAIEVVASGSPFPTEGLAAALDNGTADIKSGEDPLGILSTREREVFHLLANGLQNSSIARKLLISPRTVETHRARIVQKLGIHSNAELIHFAVDYGLAIP